MADIVLSSAWFDAGDAPATTVCALPLEGEAEAGRRGGATAAYFPGDAPKVKWAISMDMSVQRRADRGHNAEHENFVITSSIYTWHIS